MNEQENNIQKKGKKLYQRWWIWVIGLIVFFFLFRVISGAVEDAATKEIPNVMGINFTQAEEVLKESGFKVTSVETDAGSILSNDTIHNRSVKKGDVFKINDSTDPNYTYGETKSKKITIYYAKEDYVYTPEPTSAPEPAKASDTSGSQADASTVSSDWKQFLDDYEAWVDSYVAFMKKYKENPTDTSLISEYAEFAGDTVEWSEKAKQYEDGLKDMSAADAAEYTKRTAEILKKLTEIG